MKRDAFFKSRFMPKFVWWLMAAAWLTALGLGRADQVDDYVQRQLHFLHIPSLSLAVIKDGRIVKARGYGLANVELNVPATKDTVYEIASMSKQFTATAIMMLVQNQKLRLDDQITNYLSGLPGAWANVTVRQLLT